MTQLENTEKELSQSFAKEIQSSLIFKSFSHHFNFLLQLLHSLVFTQRLNTYICKVNIF